MAKRNFDEKVSILDNKIAANKTKNESIENKIKKLKTRELFELFYWQKSL